MIASANANRLLQISLEAFPHSVQANAEEAAVKLLPLFDESYRMSFVECTVQGRNVRIPQRLHLRESDRLLKSLPALNSPIVECLCSRSTDGLLLHAAAKHLIAVRHPFIIPYVILLCGEYVIEIIEDIMSFVAQLDQHSYANFVRENRDLMQHLRAKATSYWNEYYRSCFPNRNDYPGLAFLHQLERWAS